MKIILLLLLVSPAFCQVRRPDYETYRYKAAWCSVRDVHSDKVYYSDVFQFPNVNPAPNYGDEFKAYVASLKDGPDPKWAAIQCYSWAIINAGTVSGVTRNRDNDISVNQNRKKNIIMTGWVVAPLKHPELQYAWCSALPMLADARVYQHPYSEIFLFDPTYENSYRTYRNDFMRYLKAKTDIDYITHCTVAHFGGMPAAKASFDQWLKREQEDEKDQPVATHWKP